MESKVFAEEINLAVTPISSDTVCFVNQTRLAESTSLNQQEK